MDFVRGAFREHGIHAASTVAGRKRLDNFEFFGFKRSEAA